MDVLLIGRGSSRMGPRIKGSILNTQVEGENRQIVTATHVACSVDREGVPNLLLKQGGRTKKNLILGGDKEKAEKQEAK